MAFLHGTVLTDQAAGLLAVTLKPEWLFPALPLAIALAISRSYFDEPETTGRHLQDQMLLCANAGPHQTRPSWCRVQIEGLERPFQIYMRAQPPGRLLDLIEERRRVSGRIQYIENSPGRSQT
jgi:hypothetical protein